MNHEEKALRDLLGIINSEPRMNGIEVLTFCGSPAHRTRVMQQARAALGEARGTASASESLDKTQNSEQGALRASIDDQRVSHEAALRAAQQAIQWALDDDDMDAPLRGSTVGKLAQAAHTIERALAGEASGTAPTAPLSPEAAPPAPDLLRENARLRAHLTQKVRAIEKLQGACTEYVERLRQAAHRAEAAEAELTRARAAHLENAELLAKAQEERRVLLWAFRKAKEALARAADALRDRSSFSHEAIAAQNVLDHLDGHDGLALILSADRKGNAPQAPLEPAAAAPAKEGK